MAALGLYQLRPFCLGMTEQTPKGSTRQLSGGTGVALSLVISLVTGAFSAGITYGVVTRLERDVIALQREQKDASSIQHTQELKLVTLESELRAICKGVVEIMASLRQLTDEPQPSGRARS